MHSCHYQASHVITVGDCASGAMESEMITENVTRKEGHNISVASSHKAKEPIETLTPIAPWYCQHWRSIPKIRS